MSESGADAASALGHALHALAATPRLNRWMFSKLAPHVRGDVLEVGAGIGNLSRLVVGAAESLVASDVEPRFLEALRESFRGDARVTVTAYDLASPPPPAIAERRFDTIVAINVLEHVADDAGLTRALAGLLRPGGKLVVYVPACAFAFGALDRALGHHRRYSAATLTDLLSGAGLQTQAPAYMNVAGLAAWIVNGRVLRRDRLSPFQIGAFERLLPLLSIEDRVRLPIGLGLVTAATRI